MYARSVPLLPVLVTLWACGGEPVRRPAPDSGPRADSGQLTPDSGLDAGVDAGTPQDAAVDSGVDAGMIDSGPVDTGVVDSGPVDSGVMDTGPRDVGMAPVRISFPPNGSVTQADQIKVYGVSEMGTNPQSVTINGVSAVSSDGFATFSADLPLAMGVVNFDVEVDNQSYGLGKIERQDVLLLAPRDMDKVGTNLYVLDSAYRQLVRIELGSGARTVVTGPATGTGPQFTDPRGVVVSADQITAYVVDTELSAVFTVTLSSGNRTLLSGDMTGSGPTLSSPRRLILDGTRLLLIDSGLDALVAIDIASGARSIISNDTTGAGPPMASPRDLAMDPTRGRVLVTDSSASALFAINLANGDRSVVQGMGDFFAQPRGVVVSADNSTAFVVDGDISTLFSVALATGDRTVVADRNNGTGPWTDPRRVLLDGTGRLLVLDYITDAVVRVDTTTGDRTIVASSAAGTGPHLGGPWGVAVHPTQWDAPVLVTDNFYERVYTMDLVRGERRVLSDLLSVGPNLDQPYGITYDVQAGRALLVDAVLDALIGLDLTDGTRSVISNDVIGAGRTLNAPRDVEVTADGTILVADSGANAVFSVDPVSGDRTEVSADTVGTGTAFDAPWALVSTGADKVTVSDSGLNALVDTALSTGNRTAIADGTPTYVNPRGLAKDGTGRLFVSDLGLRAIVAVDAAGVRTVIAAQDIGVGTGMSEPAGIGYHPDGYLLVVDGNDALLAIHPATGDRVFVSK